MRTTLLYIIVLGCIVIASGMALSDPTVSRSSNSTETISHLVNISDILNNSGKYNGKLVTIEGIYLGWTGPSTGAQLTRSDWAIKDETGSIYVTGVYPDLDPFKDVGASLIVSGNVVVIEKGPLIRGKIVTLIGASRYL